MVELVATIFIIVSSVLLFAYWFRYTCLLILSAKTSREYASEIVANIQLGFVEVQARLKDGIAGDEFDRLRASLDRDYEILISLIEHTPGSGIRIEERLLQIDYHLMAARYRLSRTFSAVAGFRALEEMSSVVAHFANVLGEQAACAAS